MLATAIPPISPGQASPPGRISTNRYSAITAPILGTVVTNIATKPWAPCAASGTQKCSGTPPALNSRPATTPTDPATTIGAGISPSRPRSSPYAVVPVPPKSSVTPSSSRMPDNAPNRYVFMAASAAAGDRAIPMSA